MTFSTCARVSYCTMSALHSRTPPQSKTVSHYIGLHRSAHCALTPHPHTTTAPYIPHLASPQLSLLRPHRCTALLRLAPSVPSLLRFLWACPRIHTATWQLYGNHVRVCAVTNLSRGICSLFGSTFAGKGLITHGGFRKIRSTLFQG